MVANAIMDAMSGFFISLLFPTSVQTSVAGPSDRLVWWDVRKVTAL
jgi:hypothetical protein